MDPHKQREQQAASTLQGIQPGRVW
jgi:hypothetical protein